jgi:GxxExxY protein
MGGDRGDGSAGIGDDPTGRIIESIITVHKELGPGFLESVYHRALLIELRKRNLSADSEAEVLIHYAGEPVGRHRLDLVVERRVIVELKTVEALSKAHYSQVRSYLKATGLSVALLVNFAGEKTDYRRVEHV